MSNPKSNSKTNSKKESLWQKHLWRKIDARVNKTEIKESDYNSKIIYEISTLNLILLFICYIIGLFFYAIFWHFMLCCLISIYDCPLTIILLFLFFLGALFILWVNLLWFFLLIHANMDELGYYFVIAVILYCFFLYFKDRFWDRPVDKFVDPNTGKLKPEISDYVERVIRERQDRYPDGDVESSVDASINKYRQVPWESDTKKFIKWVRNKFKSPSNKI